MIHPDGTSSPPEVRVISTCSLELIRRFGFMFFALFWSETVFSLI